ncbi:MAG: GH13_9 / GH13_8 / GH13 / CBM48 / GH13_ 10 / GH13_36 [uncultured Gemmatimonadetes bacterium]|uniref:1,4-alpha-glucan branching enzyme GlgB n=1 Tax=uncultured Gemmatimonadota bacterium TaxID=203437 RepID=A0A6J4KF50_9BACT|nr:MAG: GH13_9 / GH13_8 / GH13 / CBM48 / GH13_ 10 / GH13_36 [uncultured Gemmatimonadota bacterium]
MAQATLQHDVRQIVRGEHNDPFRVLGMHRVAVAGEIRLVVRAFIPGAREVALLGTGIVSPRTLQRVNDDGFFEGLLPRGTEPFAYQLRVTWEDGSVVEMADAYSFSSTVAEFDLYLIGEGTHLRLYDVLGAHPDEIGGVQGVRFAVWAPAAQRVSVVGEFNGWDGRRHTLRRHPGVGIWEMFIPGIPAGTAYKYELRGPHGEIFLKSDPVAFYAEHNPATASVVADLRGFEWTDDEWMERRRGEPGKDRPMAVYEVHLGSWKRVPEEGDRPLTYREMAHQLGEYVTEMGFTHVELLPVMEHPYDPSWGYQVTGYFAPTSRFGKPEDFKYLVNHLHSLGIGVILDWVPAHFPKDAHALRRFDGTALYEHEDPRQGEHPDWGTLVFNFGRNEVRNFLLSNALFWIDEYHADGLRVDAVASMLYLDYSRQPGQWVPNRYGGRENLEAIDFLQQLNATMRDRYPGALMIAEESTAWPGVTQPPHLGGLGFHMKWNMGWMNDFLRFVEEDPVYRKYHFNLITFSLMYAFSERFVLPFSHDEVVHLKGSLIGKMPGDAWQKAANLRMALGFMWSHPGKKLIFMGGEFGQWSEWSEGRSLDWHLLENPLNAGVQRWMRDLNALYTKERAFWDSDCTHEGFQWIDFHDVEQTVLSFLRRSTDTGEELLFACNFTPVPRPGYRIGVPRAGTYRELLNSDSAVYGGSNLGNHGSVASEPVPEHGRADSVRLMLPPLSILVLKRDEE